MVREDGGERGGLVGSDGEERARVVDDSVRGKGRKERKEKKKGGRAEIPLWWSHPHDDVVIVQGGKLATGPIERDEEVRSRVGCLCCAENSRKLCSRASSCWVRKSVRGDAYGGIMLVIWY